MSQWVHQTKKTCKLGCSEVRWRPRQETSLAPPCSNLKSFGSTLNLLYWSTCEILGTFRRPLVFWRSGHFLHLPLVSRYARAYRRGKVSVLLLSFLSVVSIVSFMKILHWDEQMFKHAIVQPRRHTTSEEFHALEELCDIHKIWNVASAREWDFTVQMIWWFCGMNTGCILTKNTLSKRRKVQ